MKPLEKMTAPELIAERKRIDKINNLLVCGIVFFEIDTLLIKRLGGSKRKAQALIKASGFLGASAWLWDKETA